MARFRCWHVILVSALGSVILTLAIHCARGKCRRQPPSREEAMLAFLNRHSLLQPTGAALMQVGSSNTNSSRLPEEQAALWLINDDLLQLDPTRDEHAVPLQQRYALLSLWYHRSSSDTTTTGADLDHWLSEKHECEWQGVKCNDAKVITTLSLCCKNWSGRLPVDLALLTALTSLDVGRNKLSGSIPTEYSTAFPELRDFFVNRNALTGTLPNAENWRKLETYDVHGNQFSSALPADLPFWQSTTVPPTTLKNVYLHDNKLLTGTVGWCDLDGEPHDRQQRRFLSDHDHEWTSSSFTRLVADCHNGSALKCECCTTCCPNATDHACSD
jgi:hypothetical protein